MDQHPDTAYRLVSLKIDSYLAEADRRTRLNQARAARPAGSSISTPRQAVGASLSKLGVRLGGTPATRPAARTA